MIYDAAGWILTNRHVVQDADGAMALGLTVELKDGREFEGPVYGIDTLTDLAIVKVDATELPAAPIGRSADIEVGQLAIAIGSPLGHLYQHGHHRDHLGDRADGPVSAPRTS